MSRAQRWTFFVSHWVKVAEWASGVGRELRGAPAAAANAAASAAASTARLDVLLTKALRAREVLVELQGFERREAALRERYGPLAAQLPGLLAAAHPSALDAMAEPAASEGALRCAVRGTASPGRVQGLP